MFVTAVVTHVCCLTQCGGCCFSLGVTAVVVSHSACGCCFSLGRDSVCGCCFSLGRDGCCCLTGVVVVSVWVVTAVVVSQCVWLLFQSGS